MQETAGLPSAVLNLHPVQDTGLSTSLPPQPRQHTDAVYWQQPLWMQAEMIERMRVPGIIIGDNPQDHRGGKATGRGDAGHTHGTTYLYLLLLLLLLLPYHYSDDYSYAYLYHYSTYLAT